MKQSKKFPLTIFLTWNERDRPGDEGYFLAFKAASEIGEEEHGSLVGVYKFVEQRRFVTSKKLV